MLHTGSSEQHAMENILSCAVVVVSRTGGESGTGSWMSSGLPFRARAASEVRLVQGQRMPQGALALM